MTEPEDTVEDGDLVYYHGAKTEHHGWAFVSYRNNTGWALKTVNADVVGQYADYLLQGGALLEKVQRSEFIKIEKPELPAGTTSVTTD